MRIEYQQGIVDNICDAHTEAILQSRKINRIYLTESEEKQLEKELIQRNYIWKNTAVPHVTGKLGMVDGIEIWREPV